PVRDCVRIMISFPFSCPSLGALTQPRSPLITHYSSLITNSQSRRSGVLGERIRVGRASIDRVLGDEASMCLNLDHKLFARIAGVFGVVAHPKDRVFQAA